MTRIRRQTIRSGYRAKCKNYGVALLLVFGIGIPATSWRAEASEQEQRNFANTGLQIDHPRFCSQRGVVFTACAPKEGSCGIAFLDREKNLVDLYISSSGKHLILGRTRASNCDEVILVEEDKAKARKIGILDRPKKQLSIVSEISGHVTHPTLSRDGEAIVFARGYSNKSEKADRITSFDWYFFDRKLRTEVRLTNQQFFDLSSPALLGRSKAFLFATTGSLAQTYQEQEKFRKLHRENSIVAIQENGFIVRPYFEFGDFSSFPSISDDQRSLLFVARTNSLDSLGGKFNYDLFLRRENRVERLTELRTFIWWADLAPEGTEALALSDPKRDRKKDLLFVSVENKHVRVWHRNTPLNTHFVKEN